MKNTLPFFIKSNHYKNKKVQSMFSAITDMNLYEEGIPLKTTAVKYSKSKKLLLKIKNLFC